MEKSYVDDIAKQLLTDYRAVLQPHSSSGNLLNSLTSKINFDSNRFEIRIEGADYGKYLEEGTKPHFPPVDAILQWIRIKPILPRPFASGKLPTENQLAYLIGRKISKVGTEGTHLFEKTVEENNYIERVALAVAQELTKEFDEEHISKLFAPTKARKV